MLFVFVVYLQKKKGLLGQKTTSLSCTGLVAAVPLVVHITMLMNVIYLMKERIILERQEQK